MDTGKYPRAQVYLRTINPRIAPSRTASRTTPSCAIKHLAHFSLSLKIFQGDTNDEDQTRWPTGVSEASVQAEMISVIV